jgi:hypothetical protein
MHGGGTSFAGFDWSGLASDEKRILTEIRTDKRKWL